MAFSRTAYARVVEPKIQPGSWDRVRTAAKKHGAGDLTPNLVDQASEIFGHAFDPSQYLLTHATIVASVDTEQVPNVKLGGIVENGFRVNRKYGDYRIKPECDQFINNNYDSWSRPVLLKSFRTFIGGQNFCFVAGTNVLMSDGTYQAIEKVKVGDLVITHTGTVKPVLHVFERAYDGAVQVLHVDKFKKPILATGNHPFRAIDVIAPPLTVYAGSKATSLARYRKDQIASALRDGVHSFGKASPAVRQVKNHLLQSGPSIAGDLAEALGHPRNYAPSLLKTILKKHKAQFDCRPLEATEHPGLQKGRSRVRAWFVRADAPDLATTEIRATKHWLSADQLTVGSYLLGPESNIGQIGNKTKATLLGYYLAEGCRLSPHVNYGVVLVFGEHERNLVDHVARLAVDTFPGTTFTVPAPINGSLRINLYGADIGTWMAKHGGDLSDKKRLHPDVLTWDKESLLGMFAAWMAGDGSHHKGTLRLRGTSASRALAEQMQYVADSCGIKSSLVFTRLRIGEVMSQTRMVVGGVSRTFDVIPRHHCWTVLVSKDSTTDVAIRNPRWGTALHDVNAVKKRQDFAWWGNCRVHRVMGNESVPFIGTVHNFEVADDNSYVVDHGIAVHNCEHVQVESLSKGRIIDAVARDIGDSVYIDILIATDRRHTELVQAIESGKMSTLSMGCTTDETQCTQCGHVAADETELCEHVKYAKGNVFYDDKGRKNRVAELCGHASIEPHAGVQFIEASWVETPAFTGAVLRNVIEATDSIARQAAGILNSPPKEWSSDKNRKAAKEVTAAFGKTSIAIEADFDMGDDSGGGDGSGEEEKPPAEAKKSPLDDLENDMTQHILDRVKKRLRDQIDGDKEPKKPEDSASEMAPNDSLIKEGSRSGKASAPDTFLRSKIQMAAKYATGVKYAAGLDALIKVASSDIDLMDKVATYNERQGIAVPIGVYRAALSVGSQSKHANLNEFLGACKQALGHQPSLAEAKTMVRLSQLLTRRDVLVGQEAVPMSQKNLLADRHSEGSPQ